MAKATASEIAEAIGAEYSPTQTEDSSDSDYGVSSIKKRKRNKSGGDQGISGNKRPRLPRAAKRDVEYNQFPRIPQSIQPMPASLTTPANQNNGQLVQPSAWVLPLQSNSQQNSSSDIHFGSNVPYSSPAYQTSAPTFGSYQGGYRPYPASAHQAYAPAHASQYGGNHQTLVQAAQAPIPAYGLYPGHYSSASQPRTPSARPATMAYGQYHGGDPQNRMQSSQVANAYASSSGGNPQHQGLTPLSQAPPGNRQTQAQSTHTSNSAYGMYFANGAFHPQAQPFQRTDQPISESKSSDAATDPRARSLGVSTSGLYSRGNPSTTQAGPQTQLSNVQKAPSSKAELSQEIAPQEELFKAYLAQQCVPNSNYGQKMDGIHDDNIFCQPQPMLFQPQPYTLAENHVDVSSAFSPYPTSGIQLIHDNNDNSRAQPGSSLGGDLAKPRANPLPQPGLAGSLAVAEPSSHGLHAQATQAIIPDWRAALLSSDAIHPVRDPQRQSTVASATTLGKHDLSGQLLRANPTRALAHGLHQHQALRPNTMRPQQLQTSRPLSLSGNTLNHELVPNNYHVLRYNPETNTYTNAFRPSRRDRDRSGRNQIDHDVFEGLPIRQWRQGNVAVGPPVTVQPSKNMDGFGELPMPRDWQQLPEIGQQLLRLARMPRMGKAPMAPADDDDNKDEDDAEGGGKITPNGFMAKKWNQIPKHSEEPEREYLAKRRKGLSSVHPVLDHPQPASVQSVPMRKTKVRKTDGEGNVNVWEVLVPEGQTVEGEIVDQIAQEVVSVTQSVAPGTVVEGVGIANQEGVVVAASEVLAAPRRKNMPPRPKKKKKGPGRGKKKVEFQTNVDGIPVHVDSAPSEPGLGVPASSDGTGIPTNDVQMQDAHEGEDGEDSGEDSGDEGEDDDEDREDGEVLSQSGVTETTQTTLAAAPTSFPPGLPPAATATNAAKSPSSDLSAHTLNVQAVPKETTGIAPDTADPASNNVSSTATAAAKTGENSPMFVIGGSLITSNQVIAPPQDRDLSSSPDEPLAFASHSRQNSLTRASAPTSAVASAPASAVPTEDAEPFAGEDLFSSLERHLEQSSSSTAAAAPVKASEKEPDQGV